MMSGVVRHAPLTECVPAEYRAAKFALRVFVARLNLPVEEACTTHSPRSFDPLATGAKLLDMWLPRESRGTLGTGRAQVVI